VTEANRTEDERIPDEPVHPVSDCSAYQYAGLSKRELFAAMAMQGIFAHGYTMPNESAEAAEYAVRAADCLLKELAK
jgi:hypothetical protein